VCPLTDSGERSVWILRQMVVWPIKEPPRRQGSSVQSASSLHLSTDERLAFGKAARTTEPKSAHEEWEAPPRRPDPVALLERQAESWVQELAPIRDDRLSPPDPWRRDARDGAAADLGGVGVLDSEER
jgi:hypothetical protein